MGMFLISGSDIASSALSLLSISIISFIWSKILVARAFATLTGAFFFGALPFLALAVAALFLAAFSFLMAPLPLVDPFGATIVFFFAKAAATGVLFLIVYCLFSAFSGVSLSGALESFVERRFIVYIVEKLALIFGGWAPSGMGFLDERFYGVGILASATTCEACLSLSFLAALSFCESGGVRPESSFFALSVVDFFKLDWLADYLSPAEA